MITSRRYRIRNIWRSCLNRVASRQFRSLDLTTRTTCISTMGKQRSGRAASLYTYYKQDIIPRRKQRESPQDGMARINRSIRVPTLYKRCWQTQNNNARQERIRETPIKRKAPPRTWIYSTARHQYLLKTITEWILERAPVQPPRTSYKRSTRNSGKRGSSQHRRLATIKKTKKKAGLQKNKPESITTTNKHDQGQSDR